MSAAVDSQILGRAIEDFPDWPAEQRARFLATLAQARNGHGPAGSGDESRQQWQVRTLIDAYRPRPPLRYLVEGLIPEGSLNMIFGTPGSFKSILAADMTVCIASGERWLPLPDGNGGRATTATPVFWVDLDNGKRRTDERFDALAKARQLPADTPLYYVSMPHPTVNLADINSAMMLEDHVRRYSAGLVVLDNLGLISGETEENSNQMATVMGNLRKLAENTGAAVIVLHHQRKTADSQQQINVIRGHSSISASLDLAVHISRDVTESVTGAVMIPVKMRDADIPIIAVDFAYEHGDLNELKAARFFGRQLADTRSKQAIKRAVLEVLFGKRLNQTELIAAVKAAGITASRDAIRSVLETMSGRGEVNEMSGEHNAKLYSLA